MRVLKRMVMWFANFTKITLRSLRNLCVLCEKQNRKQKTENRKQKTGNRKQETKIMKELLNTIEPELLALTHRLEANAIDVVDKNRLVAWGRLRTSISAKLIIDDENPRIELSVIDTGDNQHKYAQYLHEGIKPHMPPVNAIRNWVIQKNLHLSGRAGARNSQTNDSPLSKGGQGGFKNKLKLQEQAATSIAWAIAINMKKKGKEPIPFLDLAVKMTLDLR